MKRIAFFITVLGLTVLHSRANFEHNGLFYDYISTTEKTVAVTGFIDQVEELTIPDSIEVSGIRYAVKKIGLGQRLFGESYSPHILHLPYTITEISSWAFYEWPTLERVDFSNDPNRPNQLTTIGSYAFFTCKSLKSVSLPESPLSIGYAAFEGCSKMDELDLGGTVSLGDHAFYICTALKSILLPKTVISIGEWAFSSSAQLESIAVEDGNEYYDSRNGCNAIIEKATSRLVVGCSTTVIPDGTKIIGERAFYGCRNLTAIDFPNTIETIGRFAFSFCSSLKEIELPESLIQIKKYAFQACPLDEVTIPENVENIGYRAFQTSSYKLKWLHYNAKNCTFGDKADSTDGLFFTSSVDSISFGENVRSLSKGFFDNCGLAQLDITFPNSLIGIDYEVFTSGVFGNLSFGSNLSAIYGFRLVSSVKSITILAKTPPRTCSETFMSLKNKSETLLYVPLESVDLYKNDSFWKRFFIVGVDGVDNVEEDAAKIVSTFFYDLNGRLVGSPTNDGLYLRKILYDNGSIKSEKVFINK